LMFRTVELVVVISLRLERAGEADGPEGEMKTLRVTVPEKPFTLPRLIDVVPRLCPTSAVNEEDGRAVIVKSTKWKRIEAVV
jgi:hypothetical protein